MSMTPKRWRVVKGLFDQVVDLPLDERNARLAELAFGDADLRMEVESLLAALSAEQDRFERPAALKLASGDYLHGSPGPSMVGRRVGTYLITREIGRGGMGAVYEAHRADDHFQKRVAIKMVPIGRDTELILRRFRYERQILARLEHRNIAVLLDGGVTEEGQPFFAMEYVEGRPIDAYCAERRLSLRGRLQLFRQVAGAVQYAHQNLVVHRDIKPSNILVTGDGTVKLLDFGIAKLLRPDEEDELSLTQGGQVPLTTAYASPEQIRAEAVTTATDIYSLGVVLYELLAGRPPFPISSAPLPVVRRRICEEAPLPPSQVVTTETAISSDAGTTRRLQRTLAGELDNIVLMALRKEAERRYPSVEQFSEDILRYLAGLPVQAQPDSFGYRSRKFLVRNRVTVTAGVLVLVSLVGGLVATAWEARVARHHEAAAAAEAARAREVLTFIEQTFRAADPRESGRDVRVVDVLARARDRAGRELAGQPEVKAGVLLAIARTYLGLGLYAEADSVLTEVVALWRGIPTGRAKLAEALNDLGQVHLMTYDIGPAERSIKEALAIRRADPATPPGDLAASLSTLGELLLEQGDPAGAAGAAREALGLRRRALGDTANDVANSLHNLAVALGTQGKTGEAEPLHREALAILRRLRGPSHPDVAIELGALAYLAGERHDYPGADTLYTAALAMKRETFGAEHPEVASTAYGYAAMLFDWGRYEQAAAGARAVIALRGRSVPETSGILSAALSVEGRSLVALGHGAAGEARLRESLTLRRKTLPAGHWLIATAESTLGEAVALQGRFTEAEPLLAESYEHLTKSGGVSPARIDEAAARLVRLYEMSGRPALADRYRKTSAPP
ncbi:MAG: serine/threonine-protein kinase [Gemmatimonadota bacterium]